VMDWNLGLFANQELDLLFGTLSPGASIWVERYAGRR